MENIICKVNGCGKVAKTKRQMLCSGHSHRLKRYGNVEGGFRKRGDKIICSVDGCESKHKGNGLCQSHLSRLKRNGSLDYVRSPRESCLVDGCDLTIKINGLCSDHLKKIGTFKVNKKTCYANSCDGKILGYGLCTKHYSRVRKNGSLESTWTNCGDPMRFLISLPDIKTDECIIWPFYKGIDKERAVIRYNGEACTAARVALIVNGYHPPSEKSYALHDPYVCSNPSCVNLRHLRWGTASENMFDRTIEKGRNNP